MQLVPTDADLSSPHFASPTAASATRGRAGSTISVVPPQALSLTNLPTVVIEWRLGTSAILANLSNSSAYSSSSALLASSVVLPLPNLRLQLASLEEATALARMIQRIANRARLEVDIVTPALPASCVTPSASLHDAEDDDDGSKAWCFGAAVFQLPKRVNIDDATIDVVAKCNPRWLQYSSTLDKCVYFDSLCSK
jgi:hypothetical protein